MVWSWRRWSLCCCNVPGVCVRVDDGGFVDGEIREVVLWVVRDLRTAGVVSVVVDLRRSLGGLWLSLLTGCGLEVLVDRRLFMKIWGLGSVSVATCTTVGW